MDYKRKSELNIKDNKKIKLKKINGIELENFRTFQNQKLHLGKRLTVISGRNGTMKSTLLGLISHPFRSNKNSVYNSIMETKFSDVFRMSPKKDNKKYLYHIMLSLDDDSLLKEPVNFYYQEKLDRFRIVPSGSQKGDGFFSLPSMYISLKRLFPLIETDDITNSEIVYSSREEQFISNFFEHILLRSEFSQFENYQADFGSTIKNPKGPGANSKYDINTISSGEDNLGSLVDALISFMRIHEENKQNGLKDLLTGILSIDEIEASLHPVAQINLLNFLIRWTRDYNVQVILNTHSLYLIQQILIEKQDLLDNEIIKLNFITSGFEANNNLTILENPSYQVAYSELTLSKNTESEAKVIKPKIFCEDDTAKILIERILKKHKNIFDISHSVNDGNPGTSKTLLINMCKNFPKLLNDSYSLVVFDADVTNNETNFRSFSNYFILPSLYNFPLEKEIIIWLLSLDSGDRLFRNFELTKEHFKQIFASYSITLSPDPELHIDKPISSYKNWAIGNSNDFRKLITQYVNRNINIFENFKNVILNSADLVFAENSLPLIKR